MLHRSIAAVKPPMASSHPPPPPDPAWVEIGRAAPGGGGARWATWIALLGGGDALYRTLVVADGSASVALELQARHLPGTRTLHRGGRRLPPGTGDDGSVVGGLLDAADEAARAALVSPEGRGSPRRGGAAHAGAAPAGRPAPHRPAPAVEDRRSGPPPPGP
jgi:hypothetical protein